jgi:flagellar hook-associated protein 3 FlgL
MRVSTAYLSQRGLTSMLDQQRRLADVQEQISSGRRLLRPSDDPTGAAQILRLEQALSVTDQYQRNAGNALNRLTLEESTLSSVQDSLIRIRELAVQGNNSTLGDTDRLAIAQEVRERLNELMGLANTKDANQEYLFSGYKVTTKPFSRAVDGTFSYSGDQGQRALQISTGRSLMDSDSGNDVFVNIKNGNGTFQINPKASNTLYPGNYTAAVSDGTAAIATENTVTAIAGTDGGGGGEQFILTVDGTTAVDITFGAGDALIANHAAELDSDFAAFIAGSGGAYSIVSGALSTSDLVLSKADGTTIVFDTSTSTLSGIAATVTESETTTGTPAVAPTDTAFTMSVDGTQFFTEAAAIGGTVTAAELDAALTAFVVGSGGAYTIDSGSIATGNLILSKSDGSSVAMTIDSNFSGTVGSFSGSLASGSNTGSGVFNVGQLVDPTAYVTETYSINFVTNVSGNLAYNVFGSISGQLIPTSPQDPVTNAPDYSDGASIQFNGVQTAITGSPVAGDVFTVSPSTTQDMFTTVQNLVTALETTTAGTTTSQSDILNLINPTLNEIDIVFENITSIRTSVGARLKTIDDQINVNEDFKIEMTSTLSKVRDLDIAEAAVEMQSRLIALQAAQSSYTRIQGLSLFNHL